MAPRGVPASTKFFTNRLVGLGFFAVGVGGLVSYLTGSKPTTDNSSTGISNTTLIVVSLVALGMAWVSARARG